MDSNVERRVENLELAVMAMIDLITKDNEKHQKNCCDHSCSKDDHACVCKKNETKPANINVERAAIDRVAHIEDDDSHIVRYAPLEEEMERLDKLNQKHFDQTINRLRSNGFGANVYNDGTISTCECITDTSGIIPCLASDVKTKCLTTVINTKTNGFRHCHTELDDTGDNYVIIDDGPVNTPIYMGGTEQCTPTILAIPINNIPAMHKGIDILNRRIDTLFREINGIGYNPSKEL